MSDRAHIEQIKRRLPQKLIEALKFSPSSRLKIIDPKEGVLRIEEEDFPDFYFELKEFTTRESVSGYMCRWNPRSSSFPLPHSKFLPVDLVGNQIKNWEKLIATYHTSDTILDDPATQAHYEEYSRLLPMELVGPEAEKPFVGKVAVLLFEHCDALIREADNNSNYTPERAQFIADVKALKQDIASKPRRIVFERMKRLWAEGSKKFPGIIKFIVDQISSWGIQRLLDGVVGM